MLRGHGFEIERIQHGGAACGGNPGRPTGSIPQNAERSEEAAGADCCGGGIEDRGGCRRWWGRSWSRSGGGVGGGGGGGGGRRGRRGGRGGDRGRQRRIKNGDKRRRRRRRGRLGWRARRWKRIGK